MESGPQNVVSIDPKTGGTKAKGKATRPTRPLPTDRIQFPRQLDLLRAYAAASGPTRKPVKGKDVATFVKMAPETISLANAFFTDTGLLVKSGEGFLPSDEVVSFSRAHEWNQETAAHKLAPLFEPSWFGSALLPRLGFQAMDQDEAIAHLAEEASAAPKYKNQLATLLDYLEASGLIERDGSQLRARNRPSETPAEEKPVKAEAKEPAGPRPAVASGFSKSPEGAVQFHIDVKVDMAELGGWEADRIAAFFAGIAKVLAAKGGVEQAATEE